MTTPAAEQRCETTTSVSGVKDGGKSPAARIMRMADFVAWKTKDRRRFRGRRGRPKRTSNVELIQFAITAIIRLLDQPLSLRKDDS
jgi:hypothetical protein